MSTTGTPPPPSAQPEPARDFDPAVLLGCPALLVVEAGRRLDLNQRTIGMALGVFHRARQSQPLDDSVGLSYRTV